MSNQNCKVGDKRLIRGGSAVVVLHKGEIKEVRQACGHQPCFPIEIIGHPIERCRECIKQF